MCIGLDMNQLANNISNTGMSTITSLLVKCAKGQFLPPATFFPGPNHTTPFMVFKATYTICEGLKVDASMSQSVTSADCQYDTIHQHTLVENIAKKELQSFVHCGSFDDHPDLQNLLSNYIFVFLVYQVNS
jgi:hypothetical protein